MSQEKDQDQPKQFRVNHRILGRMPALYAQHIVLQGQGDAVVIAFFEAILPPKAEYSDEDVQQMQEVGLVGECVARIAMPTGAFIDAVNAMNQLVAKIKPTAQAKKQGDEDANLPGN